MRRLTLLAALAVAAAGCGESSASQAESTVREALAALNARDGERLCSELVTDQLVERITASSGDGAIAACKEQVRRRVGDVARLERIDSVEIDGDRAEVVAIVGAPDGRDRPELFRLRREDGRFRLDGGSGGL